MNMLRVDLKELEEQTMARFLSGFNYPIRKIVDFQPYKTMTELLHQATKAERQIRADFAYERNKAFYAARDAATNKDNEAQASTARPGFKPPPKTQGNTYIGPAASSQASTGSSTIHCYKCRGTSHISFQCGNTKVMLTDEHGVCREASDGECEALAQVELAQEHARLYEQELVCQYDASPSLMVTRVLTSLPQVHEDQRLNLFKT